MGASDGFELGRVELRIEDKHRISATAAAQNGSDSIATRARARCVRGHFTKQKICSSHTTRKKSKAQPKTGLEPTPNDRESHTDDSCMLHARICDDDM
ncbi:MAG: hypothetical protein WCK33_12580 [Phycisphaerae bacterium]